MMHLVWARHGRQPLKVPTMLVLQQAGHPHYLMAQQLAADWQHLRERDELLVLLQQLRQVVAAYVRRAGGGA